MKLSFAATWLCLLGSAPVFAYDVEVMQDNGDPAIRYDIVVLGDGYRIEDQTKLTTDVQWFLADFWQETPLGEYQNFFNVKLIHVVSNETGADNGTYGAERDTALDSYFNCQDIDRLLCVNTSTVYSIVSDHVPESDTIFVIVNDPKYGGAGYTGLATLSVNANAPEVAKHEFGHSFGRLADEYESAYPSFPPCGSDCPEPNVTVHTERANIKWNIWIEASTPLPTPETALYTDVVGAFEGARYLTSGVYRSRQNCLMRSLGANFCDICREADVLAVYATVSPIDATTPASPVELGACTGSQTLSVQYPLPIPDTMVVTWWVDGVVKSVGTTEYQINSVDLSVGSHLVRVEVADENSLVLTDPSSLMREEFTWTVEVSNDACVIDSICHNPGAVNPDNPCQICDVNANAGAWTANDSGSCADFLFCNGVETCSAGACVANAGPCPDDGLSCTVTCDEDQQACNLLAAGSCLIDGSCISDGATNPSNPCLACQPGIDSQVWSAYPAGDCDDGVFCNGVEICQNGTCFSGPAPCTDDGLACTLTCDDDSDQCNTLEVGSCLIDSICRSDGSIHPDNPCLTCLAVSNPLAWSNNDAGSCSDDEFCNGAETCQDGACAAGAAPCADDALECTLTCDEATEACNQVQPGFCLLNGACYADGDPHPSNPCLFCSATTNVQDWTKTDSPECQEPGDGIVGGCSCSTNPSPLSLAWTWFGLCWLFGRRRRTRSCKG